MPAEDSIPIWIMLDYEDRITRERLFELRIQQLERLSEDHRIALENLKASKSNNNE